MHIPDGYLSPSTCAALYAASVPFWSVALRRVRRTFSSRTVPLLSVFSAFSFVVMMFNLPLPGGTTGHAVGMGMASIVLGPSVAMLAISAALLIQCLLFGDGGITTFGANCFNMAIVGSLTAYFVYRVVARNAGLTSSRRVLAAGLGGYAGINLAALCAAIEFGIQPVFFHDIHGAPLYAPYPLSVSIPAMMLGHLTFAGLAEFVLSAGMIAYLQRTNPALLSATAPSAPPLAHDQPQLVSVQPPGVLGTRKLWLVLGLLLVLTPLGILAAGSAWGEWSVSDFQTAAGRASVAAASAKQAAPNGIPHGLEILAAIWHAPFGNYAPTFVRNRYVAYALSALFGVGALVLLAIGASWLLIQLRPRASVRRGFIEKSISSLDRIASESLFAEKISNSNGLLQGLDPRAKLIGLGALLLSLLAVRELWLASSFLILGAAMAVLSRIPLPAVFRIWSAVLVFTGIIALPSVFLIPGTVAVRLPLLDWAVTWPGLAGAGFLLLRSAGCATFALIMVLTTPWNRLLRALRALGVPATAVAILSMTYRYLFVLLHSAQEMFESRRARLLAPSSATNNQASAAALAGTLLDKSFALAADVHLAMEARGFRGNIRLLDELSMRRSDWFAMTSMLLISILAGVAGH